MDSCPLGSYLVSSFLYCAACDISCLGCSGPGNSNCSGGCNIDYYKQPAPSISTCLTTCPQSYFKDNTKNTCESCDPSCEVCTGPANTECSQCKQGYIYYPPTTCVLPGSCPQSTFQDNTSNTCQLCDPSCDVCTGPTNMECTQCKQGYFFNPPSACVFKEDCPLGSYPNEDTFTCTSKQQIILTKQMTDN